VLPTPPSWISDETERGENQGRAKWKREIMNFEELDAPSTFAGPDKDSRTIK